MARPPVRVSTIKKTGLQKGGMRVGDELMRILFH